MLEILPIDEFKSNTGGEKYNCILSDPKSGIVLDILEARKKVQKQFSKSHRIYFKRSKLLFTKHSFTSKKTRPLQYHISPQQ